MHERFTFCLNTILSDFAARHSDWRDTVSGAETSFSVVPKYIYRMHRLQIVDTQLDVLGGLCTELVDEAERQTVELQAKGSNKFCQLDVSRE